VSLLRLLDQLMKRVSAYSLRMVPTCVSARFSRIWAGSDLELGGQDRGAGVVSA
jgi:hypothetical protein